MPSPNDNELNARITDFARDITEILKRAVNESVGATFAKKPGARGRRGRRAAGRPSPSRVATGRQVSPETLLAALKRGELRMEELAKKLGTSTGALKAPMKQLLDDRKAKRTGKARGTKYRAA